MWMDRVPGRRSTGKETCAAAADFAILRILNQWTSIFCDILRIPNKSTSIFYDILRILLKLTPIFCAAAATAKAIEEMREGRE